MFDIPVIDDLVKAVLFEAIGQTFAVVGMAVAKWSLGLFLLRLVNKIWHKVVIWIAMCSLMAASISVCFVFWLQCSPPAYLWDRRIDGGYCHINTTPVSFTLCSESSSKFSPLLPSPFSCLSPELSLRYRRIRIETKKGGGLRENMH